jgi:hypothetical protein
VNETEIAVAAHTPDRSTASAISGNAPAELELRGGAGDGLRTRYLNRGKVALFPGGSPGLGSNSGGAVFCQDRCCGPQPHSFGVLRLQLATWVPRQLRLRARSTAHLSAESCRATLVSMGSLPASHTSWPPRPSARHKSPTPKGWFRGHERWRDGSHPGNAAPEAAGCLLHR